jgi:hypothetical protein
MRGNHGEGFVGSCIRLETLVAKSLKVEEILFTLLFNVILEIRKAVDVQLCWDVLLPCMTIFPMLFLPLFLVQLC